MPDCSIKKQLWWDGKTWPLITDLLEMSAGNKKVVCNLGSQRNMKYHSEATTIYKLKGQSSNNPTDQN